MRIDSSNNTHFKGRLINATGTNFSQNFVKAAKSLASTCGTDNDIVVLRGLSKPAVALHINGSIDPTEIRGTLQSSEDLEMTFLELLTKLALKR